MEMKKAAEVRAEARAALSENGQYMRGVGVSLLLMLMLTVISIPLMMILTIGINLSGIAPYFSKGGSPEPELFADPAVMLPLLAAVLVFSVLFIYPLGFFTWGRIAMAVAAVRRGLTVGHAFSGWGHGWKMGWLETVKFTYVSLWSLLLVVPGVMKFFSYAMAEYVAVDHPDWSAKKCIAESCRLMEGNRLRYFDLVISFIGWWLLVVLAGTIPFLGSASHLFFLPYFETAKAAFYENLLDMDIQNQH